MRTGRYVNLKMAGTLAAVAVLAGTGTAQADITDASPTPRLTERQANGYVNARNGAGSLAFVLEVLERAGHTQRPAAHEAPFVVLQPDAATRLSRRRLLWRASVVFVAPEAEVRRVRVDLLFTRTLGGEFRFGVVNTRR